MGLAFRIAALAVFALTTSAPAEGGTVCIVLADAVDGRILHEDGACDDRVTPASTFKIALAAMGYDSGFLHDSGSPLLPFREGYPDWLGAIWRRDTDPAAWMRHSVVWYSQQVARSLGTEALHEYAMRFGYGNADFSGDPGKDNALERAWISSSLKISPREQVAFIRRLLAGRLGVSERSASRTVALMESWPAAAGWTVYGKTGSAYPRRTDGSFDRARGWGWFVGWAEKDGRKLVFARLDQATDRSQPSGGRAVRDDFIAGFGPLAAAAHD